MVRPGDVGALASQAELALQSTGPSELAIRDRSPEAYVASGEQRPISLSTRPVLERAGAQREARDAMTAALRDANEDPAAFLVHTPYVVHELRAS